MNKKNLLIFSIFFYVIPLVVAGIFHLWLTLLFILGVIVFGVLYHMHHEKKYLWADKFFAWALIISNLFIAYQGHFKSPYFWIASVFLVGALYFRSREREGYEIHHSLWHLCGALITLFCIFTYAL